MIEAILMSKFTTIIFVCIMSYLLGIITGIIIGDKKWEDRQSTTKSQQ